MRLKLVIYIYTIFYASAKHSRVPSKYVQETYGAYGPAQTPVPGMIPSNSDSFNGQSPNALNPGLSGIPFAGNPLIPTGTGPVLDPSGGRPINPETGRADGVAIDPATGLPVDPTTGRPAISIDPATGRPIDPVTGRPIDPVTGRPIDPVTGLPVDPTTGRPAISIDPVTGRPIDSSTGRPIDPATGLPVDPTTGLPIDPITGLPINPVPGAPGTIPPDSGTAPNSPSNPKNNSSGSLSKQDIIILAVFGGLFLLILLLLLLCCCLYKKREADEDKPQNDHNQSADLSDASVPLAKESGSGGIQSHWFIPFSTRKEEQETAPAQDVEAANIGVDEVSPKSLPERINEWFLSTTSGSKLAPNSGTKDNIAPNIDDVEEGHKSGSKMGFFGVLPLFAKKNEPHKHESKGYTHIDASKSSKFKLFAKKTKSDEENLLDMDDTERKSVKLMPFFLKSKKKTSDESLHGSEIIEQASIHANSTVANDDFLTESKENNNLALESDGYILPPMVRHTTVGGNRVEDPVDATDIIIGEIVSKKQIMDTESKDNNQTIVGQSEVQRIFTANDSNSGNADEFDITVIEPDSPNPIGTLEGPGNTDLSIKGDQGFEESNSNNMTGAVIVTETTTIVHQKSIQSTSKRYNYEEEEDDDLDKWAPPAPTSHVVVRSYTPSEKDEMIVAVGDLIGIEKTYNDGWAKAQNITQNRKRGMLPLAVVTPLKSGPTQTVIKSAGGIWKAGATTSDTLPNAEVINYRETSLKGETVVTQDKYEVSAVEKRVTFDTDHNFIISDISDDESISSI